MKIAFLIISVISLVSIFAVSTFRTNQNLKANEPICYVSNLDFVNTEMTITNTCEQNMTFTFSQIFDGSKGEFEFQTQCLKNGESEVIEIVDKSYGSFRITSSRGEKC
ncbi:transmembrane protein, putative (macronuclear) [Tetrahymena thermophila SB210]|uniref:Transmembrane protein, putative n=1 Tax=Tetrahymena thermophila (strain SB210) TaxID=312017 RepID=Q22WI5_TETTS|nr:transmembrane protein, putative [Tetrahymena thermophila SB210]EAR89432.1 transmembrane protein, putative [Tetrahymena thermophila SB210]|eukprot:XP_001009677.1 transmembrane protein, putative [Tetrahymena thermophila SB210]